MSRNESADHGLRYTSGHTEDHTGTGCNTKRHIAGFYFDLIECNTGSTDHPGKLRCGDDNIRILLTFGITVWTFCLHLLCRTRHNGYNNSLFAFCMLRIAVIFFNDRGEHLLRRTAGGNVFFIIRELILHKFDPSRTAGGEQRQVFPFFQAFQEFCRFFHDRQIR